MRECPQPTTPTYPASRYFPVLKAAFAFAKISATSSFASLAYLSYLYSPVSVAFCSIKPARACGRGQRQRSAARRRAAFWDMHGQTPFKMCAAAQVH